MKEDQTNWKIVYDGFKPAQEGLREAICTLGNGYFGTRGAAPESTASRIHYPGTYIAGLFNKLATEISGRTVWNEDMVNCPNWLLLTFRVGKGDWVTPANSTILSYHQELDMYHGILSRKMRVRDRHGQETTIETQRIVHMTDPHNGAIRYVITPENYDNWIVVRSTLDGTVQNTGVARYRQLNSRHLKPRSLGTFGKSGVYLAMKTNQSGIIIAEAARTRIYTEEKELRPVGRIQTKEKKRGISLEFGIFVNKKKKYQIEKTVSIYTSTSKHRGIRDPLTAAINSVKALPRFAELLKTHKQAWESLWKKFDIQITGDEFSQRILRLHTFHLLQTASPHNTVIDAGLPARGLHGEAYRGHIFWDEMFVMPFYDLHAPEISKALLLYRYRRLPQARKYAQENGYQGAMFPWQSGSTGEEETQVIHLNPLSGKWGPDHSCLQRHVSFAIAYNTWQHWKTSGDLNFLSLYGAEILLSIAQFGSSLTKYNARDHHYHTEGIMGPDEFHERLPDAENAGFRDNAYTNILIVWTMLRAREALTLIPEQDRKRIIKKITLTEEELQRWDDISEKMNIFINPDGIISQFEGYLKLKELNWDAYRQKYDNIQRLDRILKAEGKSPNDYKVAKQADVLMIFYLFSLPEVKELFHRLGHHFSKEMLKKNYEYYLKRTSHGSTLSKVAHCYVSHMIGRGEESWQWYLDVLKSDIYDIQGGTTPEGIHCGVMGGSINIALKNLAGIDILPHRIKIYPHLPGIWEKIQLNFSCRDNLISLEISREQITITIRGHKYKPVNLSFEIEGKRHILESGKPHTIPLTK